MISVRIRTAILPIAVFLSIATPAHAELGGGVATIRADGSRMGARTAAVAMRGYARHDLTRSNGGMVREFANPAGQVFAVTWSGPGKPDLRALLGRYFTNFQGAASRGAPGRRGTRALRRPMQIADADLQIQTAGHMGWFNGVAYIPSLAPAGFAPADLPVQP